MAVPGTPEQTLRPPEVTHTRPEDPNTPSLANLRTTKRHRQAKAAPIPISFGDSANKRQLVTGAVTEKITAAQEAAKTRHSIIAIANAIDHCLENYTSIAERLVAQELQQRVVYALTNSIHHPSKTTPQPASDAGPKPIRTHAEVVKPPNSHSMQERGAAITKTAATHRNGIIPNKPPNKPVPDSRILFQLSTAQRVKHPSPFVTRKALCARIDNLTLQDIPRLTTTKTGSALTPANDTIKSRLLQPDNVKVMLETLGAVGFQLPEKWINYAVQRVEAALIGLHIGGDAAVPIREENVAEEVYSQTGLQSVRRAGNRAYQRTEQSQDKGDTAAEPIVIAEEQLSQDGQPALQQPPLRATESRQAKRAQQEEALTGTDTDTATITPIDTDTITVTTTASQNPQSRRPRRAPALRESLSLAALSTRSLRTEHTVSTPTEAMIQAGLSSTIEDTEMSEDHCPGWKRLRIAWANVGKASECHGTILCRASDENIDAICIQEPWALPGTVTKNHPGYHMHAPVIAWDSREERENERPRVLTYTRKGVNLRAKVLPRVTRDILWTEVNGYAILNVYQNREAPEPAVTYIQELTPPGRCVIGGDMNARHESFEPGSMTRGGGSELARWARNHAMDFIGQPGVPTHRAGHVIDLTFSKIPFADTVVRPGMHSGSDHATQVTTLPTRGLAAEDPKKHKVLERHLERFTKLVGLNIIDGIKTDSDLYSLARWHKLLPNQQDSPLVVNGETITDTAEKAKALHRELLDRFNNADDLPAPPEPEDYTQKPLPWDTKVTTEEAEHYAIGVASTSPGADGITVRLLKACWADIRNLARAIYQRCLELEFYPGCWRVAEVTMIPKAGKKDRTLAQSMRPIALLSCIGKGLERLVARRIATTAMTYDIISPQHVGAVPKRSAMDIVAAFTHDVEQALAVGKRVTMVTMDVQGAFDALLKNRLLHRMAQQGWPPACVRFIDSFLSERYVQVRLGNEIIPRHLVACGTPQGSPLSPILYTLYLAELLNQDRTLRFGYADDINIYRASKTLDENVQSLAEDIQAIN
ncbi:reverse transcriptase [Pyrenophora tritici-repentis]|nr:reverse transcriptase [Pyrenophora tritici-repentis]